MFQHCVRIGIVAAGTALLFGSASLRACPAISTCEWWITENGQAETVLDHRVFPSSLRRGPDHALYFSECSFHCQPGDGRVMRVVVD